MRLKLSTGPARLVLDAESREPYIGTLSVYKSRKLLILHSHRQYIRQVQNFTHKILCSLSARVHRFVLPERIAAAANSTRSTKANSNRAHGKSFPLVGSRGSAKAKTHCGLSARTATEI
ncbi:unnamed protein product, partial [Trichogramma brassicae]